MIKIKTFLLAIGFVFIGLSCKNKTNSAVSSTSVEQKIKLNDCFNSKVKEEILTKILAEKELQTYLIPLQKRSLPLEILTNEFITSDLKFQSNRETVILRNEEQQTEQTFKFSFPLIDCENQTLKFIIWYEFEQANIEGKIVKRNNEWEVEISSHGIVD